MTQIKNQLAGAIEENEKFRQNIATSNVEIARLSTNLAEETSRSDEKTKEIEVLNSKIASASMEISEREQILEARQRAACVEIDQLRGNIRELNEANDFVRIRNEELEKESEILKSIKVELDSKLSQEKSTRDEFLANIEKIKSELENERMALPNVQNKLDSVSAENSEISNKLSQIEEKYNATSAQLCDKNSQITSHIETIASLTANVAHITEEKAKLITDNAKLLDEVTSCHKDLETFSTQLDGLNSNLESQKADYDVLHKEHEKLLEDEIEKIEKLEALSNTVEIQAVRLQEYEEKSSIMETANSQLQKEMADYHEVSIRVAENDREVNQLIVIKSELEEKLEIMTQQNEKNSRRIKTLEHDLCQRNDSVNSKDQLIHKLQLDFTDLTRDFNEKDLLCKELDELREKIATEEDEPTKKQLQVEITKQQNEINLLSQQIDENQTHLEEARADKALWFLYIDSFFNFIVNDNL